MRVSRSDDGSLFYNIFYTFKIPTEEKKDYDKIFDSLDPENGLLSEEKVRFVLMGLKIEVSMLDKIWSLSDQDGDGCLDRYEWTVAFHLANKAMNGYPIPDQVVISLIS